ncbi:MAG: adenylylsulfate kinase, partial [Flavobacteriales bacterium]
ERQKRHKHNSFLIWFTGLSGSGKSTLANLVEVELHNLDISTFTLDGDNIRRGINKNLGFTAADRTENIRRIAEISNLFVEAGVVVLGAFVSPYIKDRENIKNTVGAENFIEIFVNTSLAECERRDVKGLYQKARAGEIQNMTGVTDPYEAPIKADLEIITDNEAIEISLQKIMDFITLKIKRNNE